MHIYAHVYMGRADGTIMADNYDLTPSPAQYRNMLRYIIDNWSDDQFKQIAKGKLEQSIINEFKNVESCLE